MENKGLNIFNTKYVLARADTATDVDYLNIDRVVAHEYCHNWTGNRVTCRDWFQLSLKEGLTVFRDQEYGADLYSRAMTRIQEVRALRAAQFAEDAGPMKHPVRPQSYMEIRNFYTMTVYEKGAEVVRMLKVLLGPEQFRAGMDLYFARHDGEAATVEQFVQCFADVSGKDLSQFMLWYSQAGTPEVVATGRYDAQVKTYRLELAQIDEVLEPAGLTRLESPGADLERRRRAGRDRGAQRLLQRALGHSCGKERAEQDVAGADAGDRLDLRSDGTQPQALPLLAEEGEAARLRGDQDVARAQVCDALDGHEVVLVVPELLPDEPFGLALVGRHEKRLRLDAQAQRRPFRIEDGPHVPPVQIADRLGVERVGDTARQRAGEHDHVRAAREIADLLEQHGELVLVDVGAPLVDLGVRRRRRVDHRRRRPRLVGDADEVVEDRLRRQLLDDARARSPSREAGRDHRDVQSLERTGDVDALAPRERQPLARAVPLSELEVRHGQRAVDRRVEGDRDDHENQLPM